jgi:hypothetical protein
MIEIDLSARPSVFDIAGDRLSVQLMNTALRSLKSHRDCSIKSAVTESKPFVLTFARLSSPPAPSMKTSTAGARAYRSRSAAGNQTQQQRGTPRAVIALNARLMPPLTLGLRRSHERDPSRSHGVGIGRRDRRQ